MAMERQRMIVEEHWDVESVYNVCCKYELYTAGTNEQYETMLNYVANNPFSLITLDVVATDIWKHSDYEMCKDQIAFYIGNEAVTRHYMTIGTRDLQ